MKRTPHVAHSSVTFAKLIVTPVKSAQLGSGLIRILTNALTLLAMSLTARRVIRRDQLNAMNALTDSSFFKTSASALPALTSTNSTQRRVDVKTRYVR